VTEWLTPERTGRTTVTVTLTGAEGLRGETFGPEELVSTDRGTWARTRAFLLGWALREWHGASEQDARNASTVALVQLANESGWGENEWRWNAAGVGCGSGPTCQRFTDPGSDAALRAYAAPIDAARDFWAIVKRNASAETWSLFLSGDLWAWRPLWQRRIWAPIPPREANSIFGAVRERLVNGRPELDRSLPLLHALNERDRYAGPVNDPARAGREVGRRRKSSGVLLAAAAAAAAYVWS
jgi:hypothetical protein